MDMTIYEYTDENKNLLYRQIRYYKNGNKSFYSEKYVDGKWVKGIDGVERVLFNLPQIKEAISKSEKIYFVEGEKDVLTLKEKGKVATTIAGGANQKWQQNYTDSLKGADIVIIPDNDKVGQEFAMKVADSLAGNVGIIKLLDLTKKWPDLKEKGDITDVFEMVNNDKEVLEKLQELEEETTIYVKSPKKIEKINTELCIDEFDLKLKLPKFYEASKEKGVSRYYYNEEGKKITVKAVPILIVINKILKNIDTMEEKVELIFFKKGKWEKLIVDKNTLYNASNIVTLANKGIPVTTLTSKELVNWLYKLEIANYNDIKQEKTINRMGWINDTTFIPYNCKEVSVDLETGVKTWLKGLSEKKGNLEEWKKSIKSFLDDDEFGIIRFMIATGFSSCLLHILNVRGTIINLYGPSGIGKTGIIELVSSIYQSPDNIITFAATPISITILAERLSGIGLILEEKQSALDDSKISTLLYSLAEGRTRLKATKESDLIENRKFQINVITTAEEPLNENAHTGASRRTIELYMNKIFSSDEMSRKAHRESRKNYGFALEIFVNYLIDNYSNEHYKRIIEKYNDIEKELYEKTDENIVNSYVQSVAVIVLADILMNMVFEFGFSENSSIDLGIKILNQLNSEKEIDEVVRAQEIMEDYLISNDDKFERQDLRREYSSIDNKNVITETLRTNDDVRVNEYLGMYQEGIYYILPTKFNELMRHNNLSPNKIRRGFAERGYILIDDINNRFTVVKFYKGGNRRMVAYKLKNEYRFVEDEEDGKFQEKDTVKEVYKKMQKELTEDDINQMDMSLKELEIGENEHGQ